MEKQGNKNRPTDLMGALTNRFFPDYPGAKPSFDNNGRVNGIQGTGMGGFDADTEAFGKLGRFTRMANLMLALGRAYAKQQST